MTKYFHFYSIWSAIMHTMYLLNIIENTFPIALFVLVVSQFFLLIYPSYIKNMDINWKNEFILHWLPVLLIEPSFENTTYLYTSLSMYILIFNKKIYFIYKGPIRYLND